MPIAKGAKTCKDINISIRRHTNSVIPIGKGAKTCKDITKHQITKLDTARHTIFGSRQIMSTTYQQQCTRRSMSVAVCIAAWHVTRSFAKRHIQIVRYTQYDAEADQWRELQSQMHRLETIPAMRWSWLFALSPLLP